MKKELDAIESIIRVYEDITEKLSSVVASSGENLPKEQPDGSEVANKTIFRVTDYTGKVLYEREWMSLAVAYKFSQYEPERFRIVY